MKDLSEVMVEHPTLNFCGYGRSRIDPDFDMESQRRSLLQCTPAIQAALQYLDTLPRVKVTSRKARDSYELKHKAERTEVARRICYGYVSNGALIAAAYMLGLDVKPTGINATIGVGWGPGER